MSRPKTRILHEIDYNGLRLEVAVYHNNGLKIEKVYHHKKEITHQFWDLTELETITLKEHYQ